MKHLKNLILFLFLVLSVFIVAGCNQIKNGTTKYELDTSLLNDEICVSNFDLSLIRIKETKPDGKTITISVNETMVTEEDFNKLKTPGTHEITIIYKLFSEKVIINLIKDPEGVTIYELDLSSLPSKLYAGVFKISDIKIKANASNGTVSYISVTESMLNEGDSAKLNQVGTHQITITYKTLVRVITIELLEKPKDVITYKLDTSLISGTIYTNTFNLSNVKIIVNTNGVESKVSVDRTMISKDDLNKLTKAGTHTITVNYKDFKESFEVTLLAPVIGEGSFNSSNPYYSSAIGKSGVELKLAFRLIISRVKHVETYGELKTHLPITDADLDDSDRMRLIYSTWTVKAEWDGAATWNREHVWPQSKGGFGTSGAGADLHHLRPEDPKVNSRRGNTPFSESGRGGYTPRDESKGDVARIIFYLVTRYAELDSHSIRDVASSYDMLLRWNELDPVDAFERQRNERTAEIQGNRNPFIDHPETANMIWGSTRMLANEAEDYEVVVIMYLENSKRDNKFI